MRKSLSILIPLICISCTNPEKLNNNFIQNIKSGEEIDISKFIEKGGNINHSDEQGKTAIHYAVVDDNSDLLKELVSVGGDINAQDAKKKTPLIMAVQEESSEISQFLVDKKANLELEDDKDHTALFYALKKKNNDIINILVRGNANMKRDDIFAYITARISPDLITVLEDKGLSIDDVTETQNSLLHHAVLNQNNMIIDHLLEQGIDVNLQNDQGNTVLHQIVAYDLASKLIQHQANLVLQNNEGNTVFHAYSNNCEMLGLFLANSEDPTINVNIANNEQNTPLHFASKEQCINLLIGANANPNAVNLAGYNTAYNADSFKLSLLLKAGIDINSVRDDSGDSIFSYLVKIHFSELNYLERIIAQYSPDLNHENHKKLRPLTYVVAENSFWFSDESKSKVVAMLITNGAEVNYTDELFGYTPLHHTASLLNYETSSTLLSKGANPLAATLNDKLYPDSVALKANIGGFAEKDRLVRLIRSYQPATN